MTDPPITRRYFAASNSCRGFRNYYGDVFSNDRTDRLYVIKGGPGTGKSHFMKVVARRARALGYNVTEYACSSDPASLDGVLLEKEGSPTVGLLDGTPPHVREPYLPGAHDEIVNLGVFWDGRHLTGQSGSIRHLSRGKAAAYERAYAYLAAAGETDRVADALLSDCIRKEKLGQLAARLLRRERRGEPKTPQVALRRALGMTGAVTLPTFEREAEAMGGSILILEDHYGVAYTLTAALMEVSLREGHSIRVSYDPVYPHKIDGLLYPESGLCVLAGHAAPFPNTATRHLALRRYVDPDSLRRVRGELRHARALREELTEAATHMLASAATQHFDLEKIYAAAMDFTAKEAFTESFCEELFRT